MLKGLIIRERHIMRKSIWTIVVIAALAISSPAGADPLTDGLIREIGRVHDSLSTIPAGRPGDFSTSSPAAVQSIIEELQSKTYTQLFAIKISQEQACMLVSCRGVNEHTVSQLADAVLSARDKDQSMKAASINSTIAISGGVLAILSFIMSHHPR
jgi:hypothetical protein